jgi:SAM-dependent methyltransferase
MTSLKEVTEYLNTIHIIEDQVDQGILEESPNELNEYRRIHARRLWRSLQLITNWGLEQRPLHILELGAMPYYFTGLLCRYIQDCEVTGVNIRAMLLSEKSTEKVKPETIKLCHGSNGRIDEIAIYVFNIERESYPFPDASFDIVLCMEVIEHLVYSPTHMLAEAHRVLKPGGRLLLSTPNAVDLHKTFTMLLNRAPGFPYSGYSIYGRHNREFTLDELCQLVKACGYKILETRLESIYTRKHYHPFKRFAFSILNFIENVPLPYLRAKREYCFLTAEGTGKPRFAYPKSLYHFSHLYPSTSENSNNVNIETL